MVPNGLDLSKYPFDTQQCHFYFGSWTYYSNEVNITKYQVPVSEHSEWLVTGREVIGYEIKDSNLTYSALRLTLDLQRRISLYAYYVVVPYFTATLFALSVFALPLKSDIRLVFSALAIFILTILMIFVSGLIGTHSVTVPYASESKTLF